MRVVAICGSLRKASCNMGMLRHCKDFLSSKGTTLDIISTDILGALPLLNMDTHELHQKGAIVQEFYQSLSQADAFLFATCEYNGSISAPLKNAIDWGSICKKGNLWNDKPVAIIGAGGYAGTTRAQGHLRDICHNVNLKSLSGPFGSGLEVRIQIFQDKPPPFNEAGDVQSKFCKDELDKCMTGLIDWTNQLQKK
jgi:chromate reductase